MTGSYSVSIDPSGSETSEISFVFYDTNRLAGQEGRVIYTSEQNRIALEEAITEVALANNIQITEGSNGLVWTSYPKATKECANCGIDYENALLNCPDCGEPYTYYDYQNQLK